MNKKKQDDNTVISVSDHDSNHLPSGAIGFVTVSDHDSNRAWKLTYPNLRILDV